MSIGQNESNASIIQVLKIRIDDEIEAIKMYSKDLDNPDFSDDEKKIIKEIMEDEKDHLVLLTAMLEDRVGSSASVDLVDTSEISNESVVVEKTTTSDQLLRWIEANLDLKDPSISDSDNSYTYVLADSKVYGRVYSKLEKITSIQEVRSSSMTTNDYSSTHYKRTVDPKFTINLLGDFKNDEYSLIVVEG